MVLSLALDVILGRDIDHKEREGKGSFLRLSFDWRDNKEYVRNSRQSMIDLRKEHSGFITVPIL
jgi:hypothetical protein